MGCITVRKEVNDNMTTKIALLTLTSVFVVGGLALSYGNVSAYRGDPAVQGPNYTPERHEAMQKAFSEKNYDAWKNLMAGRGRVTQVINQDNFAKFAQMHQYMLEGKTDEANKIRAELGLGLHNGSGKNSGMTRGRYSR